MIKRNAGSKAPRSMGFPSGDRYTFTIHGRLPGNNEWINANRTNIYSGHSMKKEAEQKVMFEIVTQLHGLIIEAPVKLSYRYFEPNRKRDMDNIHAFASKVIQDSLVKAGVLSNDGWKNIKGFEAAFDVDKEDPRIEVTIEL